MHRNDTRKDATNFCFRDKFLTSFYLSGTILVNEIFFKEYLLIVLCYSLLKNLMLLVCECMEVSLIVTGNRLHI